MATTEGKRVDELELSNKIDKNSYFLTSINGLARKVTLQILRRSFVGDTDTEDLDNKFYSVEKLNKKFEDIAKSIQESASMSSDEIIKRIDQTRDELQKQIDDTNLELLRVYEELKGEDIKINLEIGKVRKEMSSMNSDLNTKINEATERLTLAIAELTKNVSDSMTALDKKFETALSTTNTKLDEHIQAYTIYVQNTANKLLEIDEAINALKLRMTTAEGNITALQTLTESHTLKITALENKFQQGTSIPTSLEPGQIYFQYFV